MLRQISCRKTGLGFAILLTLNLASCGSSSPETTTVSANQSIVKNYVDAYNARNLQGMSQSMHTDIEWINIDGSDQEIVTGDKANLVAELTSYFADSPKSVSLVSDWAVNGKYVSVKETVSFKRKDGTPAAQASLSVYEIENSLIRRVWYFPAE